MEHEKYISFPYLISYLQTILTSKSSVTRHTFSALFHLRKCFFSFENTYPHNNNNTHL